MESLIVTLQECIYLFTLQSETNGRKNARGILRSQPQ